MEPKYYTPTLNEFFDGFEYESLDLVWNKTTFDFRDLEVIDDEIREGKIRVKHLDREDIESFGFVYSNVNSEYYSLNGFDLTNLDNNYFNIYEDKGADEYCFRGTIKNKSELKKLIQMLNII